MQCPNCQSLLRTIKYEGINIETCPCCEGEWVDAEELLHVVKVREEKFSPKEREAIAAATKITGVDIEKADRDLKCPKCGGSTDAINYGGDSGIVIDRCTGCRGIWLDKDELENIQMLIEGWDDGLPDLLKEHSAKLRQIAVDVEARSKVKISRFGFINSIINGIISLGD